ncbi:tetratricopeptide repeat protein [Schlesneria paludicola]|uniref:tetratricopeptide repeat protein n=1 Tax=Schlesneria paludicola TaxID=360056 RepID=UPI00029B1E89|nr:tetratricopeptide repeat protein [Schlesneria paludicola]
MGRITCSVWIGMTMCLVGCNSMSTFGEFKSKSQPTATSRVGSPEFSSSKKLKDPVKMHLAYAGWHEQSGNYQEARKSYLKVLQKSPKDVEAMLGLARVDRAFDRQEEADRQLQKTFKLHPKDPRVLVAMGQVHASRQEWPEALEKMQAAHKLDPYEKMYEYHLAVVEAQAGEITAAMEHFTRSVGQAEAHYNVGFILNEQGNTSEAEFHLMKALKLKPDLKQAEQTLAALRTHNHDPVQPVSYNKKAQARPSFNE